MIKRHNGIVNRSISNAKLNDRLLPICFKILFVGEDVIKSEFLSSILSSNGLYTLGNNK